MNQPEQKSDTLIRSTTELAGKIAMITVCRVILNTAKRFAYPFAPVLARGLGVPLTAVTSMIAVNQATGIFSAVVGPLADRFGYRRMMLFGMGLLGLGLLAGGLFPYYIFALIGLFFAGLGKNIFDPALQAYIGRRVPFHRRGMVVGILEVSWAGSSLIGMPLVGLLIARYGWQSPFLVLGALSLAGMFAVRLVLDRDKDLPGASRRAGFWEMWCSLGQSRIGLGALLFGFWVSAANDNLFVVYGAWWEGSFDLGVVALGLGATVIGFAELCGEFVTALISDRVGLARSVILGAIASAFAYFLLPWCGSSLSVAAAGMFVLFLCFEFTIVACLSFCTELLPNARATMMSGFLAAAGLGRVLGALIGGPVWLRWGITGTGWTSAIMNTIGLACLLWGMKSRKGHASKQRNESGR